MQRLTVTANAQNTLHFQVGQVPRGALAHVCGRP